MHDCTSKFIFIFCQSRLLKNVFTYHCFQFFPILQLLTIRFCPLFCSVFSTKISSSQSFTIFCYDPLALLFLLINSPLSTCVLTQHIDKETESLLITIRSLSLHFICKHRYMYKLLLCLQQNKIRI